MRKIIEDRYISDMGSLIDLYNAVHAVESRSGNMTRIGIGPLNETRLLNKAGHWTTQKKATRLNIADNIYDSLEEFIQRMKR